MAVDRNLIPAFTWNAGGLGPGSINQDGIDIHIDTIWLNSIIILRVRKYVCVHPSVLQAHHWTILGIIVLGCRDKQLTISCKIDCTNSINGPRCCISLSFNNFKVRCTANCLLQQGDLDSVCQGEVIRVLLLEMKLLTPMGS
jgi:hypothetical protein